MYTNHSFNYRQETHWRQIVEGQYQRFVPFQVIKGDIGGINISKQAILGPLAGWTLRKRTGRKVGLHDALGSRHPVWEHMIRIAQVSLIQIYIIWNCCKHTQKNQHKRWISICWGTHACILLPIQRSWLARHESHYKIYKCWALKFPTEGVWYWSTVILHPSLMFVCLHWNLALITLISPRNPRPRGIGSQTPLQNTGSSLGWDWWTPMSQLIISIAVLKWSAFVKFQSFTWCHLEPIRGWDLGTSCQNPRSPPDPKTPRRHRSWSWVLLCRSWTLHRRS